MTVRISPEAAQLLTDGLAEFGDEGDAVRVSVVGGGLAGPQYGLDFDAEVRPDDLVLDLPGGRKAVVDPEIAAHMDGITIDVKPVESDPERRPGLWFRREGG
jgi:iron-sulfur cluster assembly protein